MGSEEGQQPTAGWYEDPAGRPGVRRYWDGKQWTDQFDGAQASAGDEKRFASLRTIAGMFRVLGWLTAILGTIVVVVLAIAAGENETIRTSFGSVRDDTNGGDVATVLIGGGLAVFFYTLLFFGASALIHLALSVEETNRRTAAAVERLVAERN